MEPLLISRMEGINFKIVPSGKNPTETTLTNEVLKIMSDFSLSTQNTEASAIEKKHPNNSGYCGKTAKNEKGHH